ncbi:hypothetical protein BOX15_Mlig031898g1 [Macrostomum lignano]|uniref:Tektin n=1 Tax=Macrostomum lignano TaxID=282301 RepID=A0A267FKN6_9PLAT|nr:hypothetical protein BOX15_Mlig031898g1 [Macrostomum lignano]
MTTTVSDMFQLKLHNQQSRSDLLVRVRSAAPLTPQMIVAIQPTAQRQQQQQSESCFFAVKTDSTRGGSSVGSKRVSNPTHNTIASRHTNNDWANFNKANERQSNRVRSAAEQSNRNAWSTMRDTEALTRVRQADVTEKLSKRVEDIEYWKLQLASEAKLNSAETEDLVEHIQVLESYLAYTAKPLNVTEVCLAHREQRTDIDLVHDEVERQLHRELECIRKCQDQMRRMVEKSTAQLSVNWAALQQLNKDLRNKTQAQSIDGKIIHLGNQSPGIDFRPGAESAERCVSIPHSWARHSQENIGKSHACRAASERQCKGIADLLRACANEMWSQFIAVNAAFAPRIREVTDVRNGLQAQLQGTLQEIADAERSAAQLRRAIEDKAAPMKVAQTRLEERARRQDMESCNDTPMIALQREVADLHESLSSLAHRLKSVESALVRLHSNRDKLESDIRVKENSLLIDVKRCMAMRKAPRGAQQLLMQPRRAMP